MRYTALPFIVNVFRVFLRVGLCAIKFFKWTRGRFACVGCELHHVRCDDRVDPSPRDRYQEHVRKWEPLIA